ncbi:MlaD family protein [Spirochaeta africana]|uniref:ABC-type transport system involved in resistance to organic solvents, periplasmic component n=1 Tax=Spirochaeta africana (strain ATCC 700263 / DSM 8902 / Z-7692) TaxID=889378 RepID=H9UKN8_SPIAZ|nr:MlaD family protein [Spirochaeta africana]AFG38081.1 ABC-type transport system involved in resistance to organic solvents, periplasmic component [Spirochaeta africana DSM 8902]
MRFRLRHADKFVGLFFLVSLVFIITALIVIGSNQRWFASEYEYHTRFLSAVGLSRNLPVRLSGFEIGKVIRYELNQDNQVDVTFVVYDTYRDRIHPGSVVELKSNPLGLSGELALYPGVQRDRILDEGSFIPRVNSPEGRDLVLSKQVVLPASTDPIAAILDNVEPLLRDLQTTVSSVNRTLTSVERMADQVDRALAGSGDGPVAEILANLAAVTASFESLAQDLETPDGIVRRIVGAEGSLATLLDDDNELYNSILRSLLSVEGVLDNAMQLSAGLERSSPQLGVLLIEIQAAIDEARMVMEGVRNNPLLRGGIDSERRGREQEAGYRDAEF